MTKVQNSNCDKIQTLKFWQNLKTQIGTKLKTQIVTKLRKSVCDKIQWVTKLKNSNCETPLKKIMTEQKQSNCDKTQKLKLWQISKNQIVTKLKNSNCDSSNSDSSDGSSYRKNSFTPQQLMRCVQGSFSQSCDVL